VSQDIVEHRFTCPYCWESITMLLDLSAADQTYVEDCEVCCNPITLRFRTESGAVTEFHADQMS
jgi:transcription elongation factor Elf1